MDSSSRVVFLDIDGVLTNIDIDGTSFHLLDPSRYTLSKANMHWLDVLLAKTGAKIVIASNWRKFSPQNAAWQHEGKLYKSTLPLFQELYKDSIVGMLPPKRHTTKCDCLELWFEDNSWLSKSKGKYVILEDDLREGYQSHLVYSKHLVLTDYRVGLTEQDVGRAVSMLCAQ